MILKKNQLAVVALVVALTACSGLPKYINSKSEDAATITNWSQLVRCNIIGKEGNICSARVIAIDGKKVNGSAPASVLPGSRQVMLFCMTSGAKARSFGQSYFVDLKPRSKYELQPRWQEGICVVDIVDTATKQIVPVRSILDTSDTGV